MCDVQKRDVSFSDDPTDEDFKLFSQKHPNYVYASKEMRFLKSQRKMPPDIVQREYQRLKLGNFVPKLE